MQRYLLSVAALLALALTSGAQATHTVSVNGLTFTPANLTICEGDTVLWVWTAGFHDVTSGTGGVADGAFSSGAPVFPPFTFSLTFDAAFLAANPRPGNLYDYFCSVHVGFGMTGTVTVGVASATSANGSGVNPVTLSNQTLPRLGMSFTVDLDCSAHAASFGAWFGATGPVGNGILIASGEYLLPPGPIVFVSSGPHNGGVLTLSQMLPNNPALCGRTMTTQGICLGAPGPQLSNAIQATAGP